MNAHPGKILVAQTIYLGDLVLTLPLLSALRRALPDARIDVLVQAGLEDVVMAHPVVSRVHSFEKQGRHRGLRGIHRLAATLRAERYDLALVLPGSLRTTLAVWLARIPVRIGGNIGSGLLLFEDMLKFPGELKYSPGAVPVIYIEKWIRRLFPGKSIAGALCTRCVAIDRARSAPHRHLQLLEPLGIAPGPHDPLDFGLVPNGAAITEVDAVMRNHTGASFVAIASGSAWPTKRWPTEFFAAVACGLTEKGRTVVLVGGAEDRTVADAIVAAVHPDGVINTCGSLAPTSVVELLHRCELLVTNDSAPAHLAQAAGTPCITILGPTIRAFGFAHDAGRNVIVENASLTCRPCTPHGGNRCPLGTHVCMTSIEPRTVLGYALSIRRPS
jgi:heptosyltransferase II